MKKLNIELRRATKLDMILMGLCTILMLVAIGLVLFHPKARDFGQTPVVVDGVYHQQSGGASWRLEEPDPNEITDEMIFNSYSQSEYEVNVRVRYAAAYDKPYNGKLIGYVIGEDYDTKQLLNANYSDRIGLFVKDLNGIYTGENGIHSAVTPEVEIVWIDDDDATLGIVPHPEYYDNVDFGE